MHIWQGRQRVRKKSRIKSHSSGQRSWTAVADVYSFQLYGTAWERGDLHKSVAVVKDWDLHALVRTQLQLRSLHDEAQVRSLLFDLSAGVRLL